MFGHNTNDQANSAQHGSDTPVASSTPGIEPETIMPTTSSAPVVDDSAISSYVVTDLPGSTPAPAVSPDPFKAPTSATTTLASESIAAPEAATPTAVTPLAHAAADSAELLELKQSALHELSPLLGHLEQSPEEKFRTTMMMIQASDDHTMLQAAYEAAKAITDEKIRAQALLDVVNEINYFTQAGDAPNAN